ncbi:DUF4123 domain-containing protein [Acinetobacter shaoyimingii]|uniref:DUF4123 domain-containing protein n=1 Tax=Acinetobacter shaoyimingii TaxID=2715164 RepID=A0A6G8RXT4_9GAMM|nr:DUF4123 domain-containing protein [Acinetobacter shaoyimingii]NHB57551.1 DUF4123 domain-containing protein [Acinetobacter shaoyimingii]QIO06739.1 DUF4123 domain-containing protein [Acinetobacter shaoyimingii]
MSQSNKLQVLYRTFQKYPLEEIGLNAYALADAAQDKRFLKALKNARKKCLLKEASGEKAKEISPHLIQLPHEFDSRDWAWIEKNIAGGSAMTIIITPLNFEFLYAHLRHFIEVEFDGGLEMILAFWDPLVLATLLGNPKDETLYVQGPVCNQAQFERLMSPIQSWWYWDRLGNIQAIFGLNERVDALPQIESPLHFDVEQEEMMVEATFPDHLIYYLKLNNGFLVDHIDDYTLYQFVVESIPEARAYLLSGTRDILNFICLKLIYKENFAIDTKLQAVLEKVKNKDMTMDQAMSQLVSKAG